MPDSPLHRGLLAWLMSVLLLLPLLGLAGPKSSARLAQPTRLVRRIDPYPSDALSGYSGDSRQLALEAVRHARRAEGLGPTI